MDLKDQVRVKMLKAIQNKKEEETKAKEKLEEKERNLWDKLKPLLIPFFNQAAEKGYHSTTIQFQPLGLTQIQNAIILHGHFFCKVTQICTVEIAWGNDSTPDPQVHTIPNLDFILRPEEDPYDT